MLQQRVVQGQSIAAFQKRSAFNEQTGIQVAFNAGRRSHDLQSGLAAAQLIRQHQETQENKALRDLTSECPFTRYEAAQALAKSGDITDAHEPVLAQMVANDDSRLARHAAARALGTMGMAVSPHAAVLARALRDQEMLVRRDAAKALANASAEALWPHAQACTVALEDNFWPVRLWACRALAVCGPPAAATVENCARKLANMAMNDSEEAVRDMAAKALVCFGNSSVEPLQWLVENILCDREDLQNAACRALASVLSGPDQQARKLVMMALYPVIHAAEEKERQRMKAQISRGTLQEQSSKKTGPAQVMAALEAALEDEDWHTRLRAVEELRTMATR